MTLRWAHFVPFLFGLAFLVLGILSLADGKSGLGTVQFVLAAGWVLVGLLKSRRRPV